MFGGGWSFVFLYLIGYIFDNSYSGSIPPNLVLWVAVHGIIALLTLLSVTVLIWARISGPDHSWGQAKKIEDTLRLRAYINDHHRLLGSITALLWLFTQAGGFINLYILR